jgi:hypothetical protein
MAEVCLLRGETALVDDEDMPLVSRYRWHLHSAGYAVATTGSHRMRKNIWMHRLVLAASCHVDHIDHNRLNNQKRNLRVASVSQNGGNRLTNRERKTSKFKGVYWHKPDQRWRATVQAKCGGVNRQIYIGQFSDETEAARAYNRKAIELFGEFAKLNPV